MRVGPRQSLALASPSIMLMVVFLTSMLLHTALASPSRRFSASSSAVLTIKTDDSSFFGASAHDQGWGAALPPQKISSGKRPFYSLVYTTSSLSDPIGCTSPAALANKSSSAGGDFVLPENGSFVLLVDRGGCAFSLKALYAQQLGAVALVVTDTQQESYNRSIQTNATPEARALEFNCKNGRAEVASDADLTAFTSKDWATVVNVPRCADSSSCDSKMCIPSGKARQVCCVWDVADAMGFVEVDGVVNATDEITVPVVRLTIADGMVLKEMLATAASNKEELLVTLYKRGPPIMDPSSFIIWLLAIITVMVGGYKGATVERERALRKQSAALVQSNNANNEFETTTSAQAAPSLMDESIATNTTAVQDAQAAAMEEDLLADEQDEEETMDLNVYHAIGFVLFATVFLVVLFYWNVVIVVVILFAIGSVTCSFLVLWQPLFNSVSFMRLRPFAKNPPTGFLASLEPETWTVADVFGFVWSLAISLLWFINRNRQYAWLLQDVFGVCLCILFLRTIRLPNLKIATFMLVLVFVYDIFMVFLSVYIFNESLMIKAATGGAQAEATVGTSYCVRYPSDTKHNCLKEEMPILLRFPKVIDWRAGQSMLGLGDIVLPGLLVVFCARFDYATRGQLLGRVKAPHLARLKSSHRLDATADLHDFHQPQTTPELTTQGLAGASKRGLYGIMLWGYAIGLLAANIGVTVMKKGQPALMYLVPSTLGLLYLVAWRRGIVKKLWDGPEEFNTRSGAESSAHDRAMTMRDRGFTMDHVIHENDDDGMVVIAREDATPLSTYSRTGDTPKRGQSTN